MPKKALITGITGQDGSYLAAQGMGDYSKAKRELGWQPKVKFEELNIPELHYNLGVGSGLHGWQTGEMLKRIEKELIERKGRERGGKYSYYVFSQK